MASIKVGFVGCGGIMQEHYRHLSELKGVEMVGHCDIIKERAEDAVKRFGGKAFTEFEAMYDKTKPEAVFIAVPPYAHCGMEEAAAARGIHIFVEKPLGLQKETALRVNDVIKKAKILASVGYCFRYLDTVAVARDYLKKKCISLVSGCWNGGMPGVWWWRQMDKSGGQFIEQTTHMVDLMRYLCGEVSEVHAVASTGCMTHVENFDVQDSSVVNMRLKSGTVVCITSSCVANHGGRAALDFITPEATVTFTHGTLTIKEDGKNTEYVSRVNMYAEEDKAFIEAVRTGKASLIRSTYADAMKSFFVTTAATESIKSGLPAKP